MKAAIYVFCGISIFLGVMYVISGLANMSEYPSYLGLLIYGIAAIAIAIVDIVLLAKGKLTGGTRIAMGILTLILSNLIAGILILCLESAAKNKTEAVNQTNQDTVVTLEEKLKNLDAMKSRGLISEEEYEKIRRKIIDNA